MFANVSTEVPTLSPSIQNRFPNLSCVDSSGLESVVYTFVDQNGERKALKIYSKLKDKVGSDGAFEIIRMYQQDTDLLIDSLGKEAIIVLPPPPSDSTSDYLRPKTFSFVAQDEVGQFENGLSYSISNFIPGPSLSDIQDRTRGMPVKLNTIARTIENLTNLVPSLSPYNVKLHTFQLPDHEPTLGLIITDWLRSLGQAYAHLAT